MSEQWVSLHNFIQINGTAITQEQIKQLPQEQQVKLFEVLKLADSRLVGRADNA
jgi:hypothetical protein